MTVCGANSLEQHPDLGVRVCILIPILSPTRLLILIRAPVLVATSVSLRHHRCRRLRRGLGTVAFLSSLVTRPLRSTLG